MKVAKRNGRGTEEWNSEKVARGLRKSSLRTASKLTENQIESIVSSVTSDCQNRMNTYGTLTVDDIYGFVTVQLEQINPSVLQEYLSYNKYKSAHAEAFNRVRMFSDSMLRVGDKENANKDTALNSTKQSVISETTMKEMMRTFELEPEWVRAHDEGWIHIHDLGSKFLNGINCCLFDMGNLLKGGFEINGLRYREPQSVQTAFNVIGDVTLSASGNQFGGFTIPEIDTILKPYAEQTFVRWVEYYESEGIERELANKLASKRTSREIEKGYIGFETKINTISNSLGQTPFTTITFGMDTNRWAREISRTILRVRKEGIDQDGTTVIFPKLVFLSRLEVNRAPESPNYDLYLDAIQTSSKRMYPDYLSLDGADNNLAAIYEESGKIVSPMGCRAFLGKFFHPETNEMVITGRCNIGAVSLNLPKMAIEAKKDREMFFSFLDTYSKMAWDIHDWSFERIAKSKGSTNPLLFCEGGSWMSVGYEEEIRPIVSAATASLGYVGLQEACAYLFGQSVVDAHDEAVAIVRYLKFQCVETEQEKHGFIPALYSTPAESLAYRFQKLNRNQYGVIKEVTDREYMTNSFHVHVTEEISPIAKMQIEADYHALATGGRITFAEYPYGVTPSVLRDCIHFAMKRGLYKGVNIVCSSCALCGKQGDFQKECPVCHNQNITTVTRACGYLSFSKIKGDSRYNLGKQAEIRDRVKHLKEVRHGALA